MVWMDGHKRETLFWKNFCFISISCIILIPAVCRILIVNLFQCGKMEGRNNNKVIHLMLLQCLNQIHCKKGCVERCVSQWSWGFCSTKVVSLWLGVMSYINACHSFYNLYFICLILHLNLLILSPAKRPARSNPQLTSAVSCHGKMKWNEMRIADIMHSAISYVSSF
jgi:hypothetical protein